MEILQRMTTMYSYLLDRNGIFYFKLINYYTEIDFEFVEYLEKSLLREYCWKFDMQIKILEYFYNKSYESLEDFVTELINKGWKFPIHIEELEYLEQISDELYKKFINYALSGFNLYCEKLSLKLLNDPKIHKKYLVSCTINSVNRDTDFEEEIPLIIRNHNELYNNYVIYGSEILDMIVINNNYFKVFVSIVQYNIIDTDSAAHITVEEITELCDFCIENFNMSLETKENIVKNHNLYIKLNNNNEFEFIHNGLQYIVHKDMLDFFYLNYRSQISKITPHSILLDEIVDICNKCEEKFGTNMIRRLETNYQGYYDINGICYYYYLGSCGYKMIEKGSIIYDFLVKINEKYIFSFDEINNFKNMRDYCGVLYSLMKYVLIDFESLINYPVSELELFSQSYYKYIESTYFS